MTRRLYACGLVLALALGITACRFELQGLLVELGDGGAADLHVGDLSLLDGNLDQGEQDLTSFDQAGLCTPSGPTSACTMALDALLTCNGRTVQSTACPCASSPTPHCIGVDPGGPATPSDYQVPGLFDADFSAVTMFYTDGANAGQILGSPTSRAPGPGVDSGIGFRVAAQSDGTMVAIWSFHSMTVENNATIRVVGSLPIVLVSAGNVAIHGTIDVEGDCTMPAVVAGGGLGGVSALPIATGGAGGGKGGGGGGQTGVMMGGGGGGGGGFGDLGGQGASGDNNGGLGGADGAFFGDLTVADPVLVGGSGGGAGGSVTGVGGAGGRGGGAVQIASNMSIMIDTGTLLSGGCHGSPPRGMSFGGGGGGGAGGMFLLEARSIVLGDNATIAVNGGAGGGGGDGKVGEDGKDNDNAPKGGNGGNGPMSHGSDGGDGGAAGAIAGQAATAHGGDIYGGGGGGAVGRIGLKTQNSQLTMTANTTLSPNTTDMVAGHPKPPVTLGTVQYQ